MYGRKAAVFIFFILSPALVCWSQAAPTVERFNDPLSVRPIDKVLQQVDETQRVRLARHVHPLAKAANMVGSLLPDQPMQKMVLVLRPDPSQEEALDELIQAQQDPASPYYHQWLSPEEFGERFGVSANDLAQVTSWLEMHGMQVDEVPSSRRAIVFSGTAGQVETAFHTQMRKYSVKGQIHFANATDPEIPQALAEVVCGIVSLHDFHSAPAHTLAPTLTAANGAHFLMPGDWATIYDVNPLYSQGLDGTGQSIAVVGRTDISLTDVRTFRTNAALPANDPQVTVVNGVDPGWPDSNDEAEAALDVEWAGAIAKKANINFVTAASGATDGVTLAAQYAVHHNVASIVSVSYLSCENNFSDGGQSLWGSLWSEAASQGQSIFVASGDTGAAGCDAATEQVATQGRAVNAICSTPNSTCVGGTEFDDTSNPGAYWSPTNGPGQVSALGYIPELAWNETGSSGTIGAASGGGISTVYARPSWQSAPGVPAGTMRYVPDIAASSAINDAYIIEFQGGAYYICGTSASTPSLASVMALVQENAGGTPLGNVNPALYTLFSQQFAGGPAVFHDITSGNNSVPGVTGYSAAVGYDMVTGLGSMDAFLVVNSWKNSAASNFSLAANSSNLGVIDGNSTSAILTMSAQGGFSSPVTLSAAGAPSGVTVSFSSPTVTPAAPVTMTVTAAANTPADVGPIAVMGTGGGFKRTLEFTLTVVGPYFTLTPNPVGTSVNVGSSTSFTVSIARFNGFNSPVALSVGALPQGVTASFSPPTITSGSSSTLTVSVSSGAAAGTSALAVTGTSGSLTQTQSIILTVANPNFTLTTSATSASVAQGGSVPITVTTQAGSGFNSIVYLSVLGLPSGVTASYSSTSIPAPGTGGSILTLSVGPTAPAGVFTLYIGAVGAQTDKTQAFSLTILSSPGFTLTPTATTASVAPGGSIPITFTTAASAGFKSAISMSVSGVPNGVTASFLPTSIASPGSGSSTLTLSATSTAPAGASTLTVTATGGGVTKTQTISLTILPTFALTPNATTISVPPGGSSSITFTSTRGAGFDSAITFSVSGAPSGVTPSFTSSSIAAPGGGSVVLELSATSTAASGVSTLTVTAAGGGITKTQTISLTVLATFTLSASASNVSAAPGASVPLTLSTTKGAGFNSAITLSVSGVPSGVTASFTPTTIAATASNSTLTLSPASSASAGVSTLTVAATGGGVTKTLSIGLTVLASFTLTPSATTVSVAPGGSIPITLTTAKATAFNSAITLSLSGAPSGVLASFAPSSISAPGSGSSTLSLSAASTAAPGVSTLTVTASGGGVTKTQAITLTVLATFALTSSATGASAALGGTVPITFTTLKGTGFNSAITLSVSGLPTGATAIFTPSVIAAPGNGSSTLKLSAGSASKTGAYTLTVTATGGGVVKAQTVTYTLVAPASLSSPTLTLTVTGGGLSRSLPTRLPVTSH